MDKKRVKVTTANEDAEEELNKMYAAVLLVAVFVASGASAFNYFFGHVFVGCFVGLGAAILVCSMYQYLLEGLSMAIGLAVILFIAGGILLLIRLGLSA